MTYHVITNFRPFRSISYSFWDKNFLKEKSKSDLIRPLSLYDINICPNDYYQVSHNQDVTHALPKKSFKITSPTEVFIKWLNFDGITLHNNCSTLLKNIWSNWYLNVLGPIFISKTGLAPWKRNTDQNGLSNPINRYQV